MMKVAIIALLLLAAPALAQTYPSPTLQDATIQALGRTLSARARDVVNVKDAPYRAKGDGATDDTAAIQSALTAGGELFIPDSAGAYLISSALTVSSGAQIRLDGVLKITGNVTLFQVAAGADNVSFSGSGEINGNKAAFPGSAGISATGGVTNFTVDGLYIHDTGTAALEVGGSANSSGVRIRRNRLSNNGTYGVFFNTATGFFVSDFDISHNSASFNGTSGVSVGLVTNGIIGWNYGEANDPGHLLADNFTGYDHRNSDVQIIGNISINGGNHGIHFGGNNVSYIGNRVTGSHQSGLRHSNDDFSPAVGVIVSGNIIDGTDLLSGIDIQSAASVTVSGNVVRGAAQRGIYLTGVAHGVVNGNTTSGNTLDGIRASASSFLTITGNTATANGANGIHLGDGTGPVASSSVTGNDLTANTGYGLTEGAAGNSGLIVVNNIMTGNTAGALNYVAYTHYTRLESNPGVVRTGSGTVTATGSPFTVTAGPGAETVSLRGGTVSSITINGTLIYDGSNLVIPLRANDVMVVTYSVAPTIVRSVI